MKNEQTIQAVNYDEMKSLFMAVEKNTLINLKYEVIVRMNKTNNPYYNQVTKLVSGNFLIGNEYGDRVDTNGKKEGLVMDFTPLKPSGKHHISLCVLANDKDNSIHYLNYEYFENMKTIVEYSIDKALFQDFLVKKSDSSRQPQEKKVNWRTIDLKNIKEFTLNGQRYSHIGVEALANS